MTDAGRPPARAAAPTSRTVGAVLSLSAAFGWATYYIFVLAISPGTAPSALLVYPFLFGGLAYAAAAAAGGHGRAFLRVWTQPAAYVRTALLVGMQVSVLAATYLAGPVDTSLLALIGDVVATPLVVAVVFGTQRDVVRSLPFLAGLVLSLAGGTLAIVGGHRLAAIPWDGELIVPAVPLFVAFYFLLTARANARDPPAAVVGQTTLAGALVTALLAPAISGGWSGLVVADPTALLVLVALGLTSFFLAPVLYFRALSQIGLVLPPMLMTGIPVFTLLLAAGFLGLGLPWAGLLGIPVAVLGAILAVRAGAMAPERSGDRSVASGP